MEYGIFGVILLLLNIYAIYNVLTSGASTLAKLLWTVGIILLPLAGFIAWLIFGPSGGKRASA